MTLVFSLGWTVPSLVTCGIPFSISDTCAAFGPNRREPSIGASTHQFPLMDLVFITYKIEVKRIPAVDWSDQCENTSNFLQLLSKRKIREDLSFLGYCKDLAFNICPGRGLPPPGLLDDSTNQAYHNGLFCPQPDISCSPTSVLLSNINKKHTKAKWRGQSKVKHRPVTLKCAMHSHTATVSV